MKKLIDKYKKQIKELTVKINSDGCLNKQYINGLIAAKEEFISDLSNAKAR